MQPRKSLMSLALVVVFGAAAFYASRTLRIQQIAYAQAPQTPVVLHLENYLNPESPEARMSYRRTVTHSSDGAILERGVVTGEPLEMASLRLFDGSAMVAVPELGLRTAKLGETMTAETLARQNRYWQTLRENRCASSDAGEQFLYEETLLGQWKSYVVSRPQTQMGKHTMLVQEWRLPAFGCLTAQSLAEVNVDGKWRKDSLQKLVALDTAPATVQSLMGPFTRLRQVKPSEFYRAYAARRQTTCAYTEEQLARMDSMYSAGLSSSPFE